MKKIAEFREKITLLKSTTRTDAELNRIETIVPTKTVWASVEVRSSSIDNTEAGHKDQRKYKITIRKQTIDCDYVEYRGRRLTLTGPWYEAENKYIIIEATEDV